jgi:hypothetical protein
VTARIPARAVVRWVIAVAAIGVFVLVRIAEPQTDLIYSILFGAATASFVVVGVLLLDRVPGNPIGSLLLLAGTLFGVAYGLSAYALAGSAAIPTWPGAAVASVLGDPIFIYPIVIALVGIPLVFPDGHLISRRWRWLVWFAIVAMAAQTFSSVLNPGFVGPANLPNPFAISSLAPVAPILGAFSSVASIVGFGGAAFAVWVRYHRGDPVERQQLKWLLAVAAMEAIFFPAAFIVPDPTISGISFILASLTLSALPIAIAIAIMRYHLYEIDRILSRTIAYGVVTGLLLAAYAGSILLIQDPLLQVTGGETIAVALSTLVVAALFQPLRSRVQRVVDRRFDRARYDAERTAAAFSERLRDEVDLETLVTELDTIVQQAISPSTVTVWLRAEGRS